MGRGRTHLNLYEKAGPSVDRIRETQAQPSPAHTLGNDDDKPVIPRIPGPRKPSRATPGPAVTA